jgi:hypothetical protein
MKKVYIVNDTEDMTQIGKLWFSDNIDNIPEGITSLKETPWLLSDTEESEGDFYLFEVIYDSEATFKEESVLYVVQALDIKEAVRIIKKEIGPSFNRVVSIDKLNFKLY